jgi:hypothetical protein
VRKRRLSDLESVKYWMTQKKSGEVSREEQRRSVREVSWGGEGEYANVLTE